VLSQHLKTLSLQNSPRICIREYNYLMMSISINW